MGYPNFRKKYLKESLINPEDAINYGKISKQGLPKNYIITFQKKALDYFKRKYNPEKVAFGDDKDTGIEIYKYKNMGLLKSGIGSPAAATEFEELICLGGKNFLVVGTAGGLHHQGIFLCDKALRDEGTSYHYVKDGKFSYPDKSLSENLGREIEKKGLEYFKGTTWTIDAPYRETKAEVEKYSKKGISTVEMEASALFTIAKFRNVKIAASFVVSDILKEKWEPMFNKKDIVEKQNMLIDSAVKCLAKLE